MISTFLQPSQYRRGRLAVVVCGGYLVLVAASWGVVVADVMFPDPEQIGASFSSLPGVALTTPTSFVLGPAVSVLGAALSVVSPAVAELVSTFVVIIGSGLVQAAIGWRLLRGAPIPQHVQP